MSIPIDFAGIVTALIASGIIGLIGAAAAMYFRLAQLPHLQQETLEEVRLLRLTIERILGRQHDNQDRWSP